MCIMIYNKATWPIYNLSSTKLRCQHSFFYHGLFFNKIASTSADFFQRFFLSLQIFLILVLLLVTSFASEALTSMTLNSIEGNAPYFTVDGGHTQVTDTDDLLGISLSNGVKFTPSSNDSSLTNPIELPSAGQSFADIGMMIPINFDTISLNTLIEAPYNYWGDADGDSGVTATGNLYLSIVDANNQSVTRNEPLSVCRAPYKVVLRTDGGTLSTRYGVPKSTYFTASNVTYYIKPKSTIDVCFAKPNMVNGDGYYAGPASIWSITKGFLTQSTRPSSYHSNFPTTGANDLYFDLKIVGVDQKLTWEPVSPNGDIKATMRYLNESDTSVVRVILTGPAASGDQIRASDDQITAEANLIGTVKKPTLPQVFELVGKGKDSNDNDVVVKYGFVLKQWFVNRGDLRRVDKYPADDDSDQAIKPGSSIPPMQKKWCEKIGYSLSRAMDLTNAIQAWCPDVPAGTSCKIPDPSTPSNPSIGNHYQRRIAAGLLGEWGVLGQYEMDEGKFDPNNGYWTSDNDGNMYFLVGHTAGAIYGYRFFPEDPIKRTAICTTN